MRRIYLSVTLMMMCATVVIMAILTKDKALIISESILCGIIFLLSIIQIIHDTMSKDY